MRIVYTHEDGDREEFTFKPRELFSVESELIEEVGGRVWGNWEGFLAALADSKGRALRAVLWHERHKARPELTFPEVIVRPGELVGYYDDDEIAEARALADDPDTPADIRDGIWAALGKGDGVAPSGTSDSDTASPSPTTGSGA